MGEGFSNIFRKAKEAVIGAGKVGLVLGALHGSPDNVEAKPIADPQRERLAEIIDGNKKVTERDPALIPADIIEHYNEHSGDDDTEARDDGADQAYK